MYQFIFHCNVLYLKCFPTLLIFCLNIKSFTIFCTLCIPTEHKTARLLLFCWTKKKNESKSKRGQQQRRVTADSREWRRRRQKINTKPLSAAKQDSRKQCMVASYATLWWGSNDNSKNWCTHTFQYEYTYGFNHLSPGNLFWVLKYLCFDWIFMWNAHFTW